MTTSVRTRSYRVRISAAAAVAAIGAVAGLSACDSINKPSTAAIEAKLMSDSEFKGLTQAGYDCLANAIHKYGTPSSLNDYIKGKISADDLKTTSKTDAQNATSACPGVSE